MKTWFKYTLRPYLHWRHKPIGQSLVAVDSKSYPFCEICGVRPKENFRFKWFYSEHVNARNALNRIV